MVKNLKKAILFYDEKLGIGLGHKARSYAFGALLERFGFSTFFYDSENFYEILENEINLDLIAIDSYKLPLEAYEKAAQCAKFAVFFDDYFRLDYPKNGLIINAAFGADIAKYRKKYPQNRLFVGSGFLLLRAAFLKALEINNKDSIQNENLIESKKLKIVLTLGGSDILGIANEILNLLCEEFENSEITCIIRSDLISKKLAKSHNVRLLWDLDENKIVEIFKNADFVLCAAGQSLLEAAACGAAICALEIASNQNANINSFENAILSIKKAYEMPKDRLLEQVLQNLQKLKDIKLRANLAKSAKAALSGISRWDELKALLQ